MQALSRENVNVSNNHFHNNSSRPPLLNSIMTGQATRLQERMEVELARLGAGRVVPCAELMRIITQQKQLAIQVWPALYPPPAMLVGATLSRVNKAIRKSKGGRLVRQRCVADGELTWGYSLRCAETRT
jgi:hypothetical protein